MDKVSPLLELLMRNQGGYARAPTGPLGRQFQPGNALEQMLAPDVNTGGLQQMIEDQRRQRGLIAPEPLPPDAAALQNRLFR